MENHHRRAIQRNYSNLVDNANVDTLLPQLLQRNVFSTEMVSKYMDKSDAYTRKRELFLKIENRGPEAFKHLVESLHATGQHSLALDLDPTSVTNYELNYHNGNVPTKKHAKPFQLPTNENAQTFNVDNIRMLGHMHVGDVINLRTEPLPVRVKVAGVLYGGKSMEEVPTYSTHSRNRGAALIINNIEYVNDIEPFRRGADADTESLCQLFTQIGLTVTCLKNLTAQDMIKRIVEFKSSDDLQDADMCVLVIMGHGKDNLNITEVMAVDGATVPASLIEEQFSNENCPALHRKPKIIMYQVCRGLAFDFGVQQRIQTDSAARHNIRHRSDILIAHSTLHGFRSHRDIYTGAWYMQLFCEICMEHAHDKHLVDILMMVDERLGKLRSEEHSMQTSTFTVEGFKRCYFNPGVYLDGNMIKNLY